MWPDQYVRNRYASDDMGMMSGDDVAIIIEVARGLDIDACKIVSSKGNIGWVDSLELETV